VKRILTIVLLALMGSVMGYAGLTAPSITARPDECHSTAIALKARDSVPVRRALTLTVSVMRSLDHGLSLTLQYRKATSSTWRTYGNQVLMHDSPYQLKWKAPGRTGRYKLRVKVQWTGAETETTYSAVKTVRVRAD
jgi:hypothetical protein